CLEMRYVHSALPNHIMSICWFLRSATISYAYATTQGKLSTAKSAIVVLLEPVLAAMKHGFAGALVYLADEAPSMQMSFWRNRVWINSHRSYIFSHQYVQTGRLTAKSDVWSFRLILHELNLGRLSVEWNLPINEQRLLQ
ncbi:hypothetical protein Tco_1422525, partial [Tanacetum coccineum]